MSQKSDIVLRSITGLLFSLNSFGTLVASLINIVGVGLGDPPLTVDKDQMLRNAEIILFVALGTFVISMVLTVLLNVNKKWAGISMLAITFVHLMALSFLHIRYGFYPDEMIIEIFFLTPILVDISLIILLARILFKHNQNVRMEAPAQAVLVDETNSRDVNLG